MKKGGTFQKSFTEEGIKEAIKVIVENGVSKEGIKQYERITVPRIVNFLHLKPPDYVIILDIEKELYNLEDYRLIKRSGTDGRIDGHVAEFSSQGITIPEQFVTYSCYIENKETKDAYTLNVSATCQKNDIKSEILYDVEFKICEGCWWM